MLCYTQRKIPTNQIIEVLTLSEQNTRQIFRTQEFDVHFFISTPVEIQQWQVTRVVISIWEIGNVGGYWIPVFDSSHPEK